MKAGEGDGCWEDGGKGGSVVRAQNTLGMFYSREETLDLGKVGEDGWGEKKNYKRREEGKIKEKGKEKGKIKTRKGNRKMRRVLGDILCMFIGMVDSKLEGLYY